MLKAKPFFAGVMMGALNNIDLWPCNSCPAFSFVVAYPLPLGYYVSEVENYVVCCFLNKKRGRNKIYDSFNT